MTKSTLFALFACVGMAVVQVPAVEAASLKIVSGATGDDLQLLRHQLDVFEKRSGNKVAIVSMPSSSTDQFTQYRLWLAARNADIDVYRVDIVWAPQLAGHLVDLKPYVKDIAGGYFKTILDSQTVHGRLVALPLFTDAGALYYRRDLLEKYGQTVPKTWQELTATAKLIQDKERAAGDAGIHGFVWQGAAYEGLTCDALEWVKSSGGGSIIESNGKISINNPKAAAALRLAASWIGTISPRGVLSYQEEEARGVWQTGNAVFMRNWPYAYSLGNSEGSPIAGKFDVAPLPSGGDGSHSAAALGGWNLAVSKYSRHRKESLALVRFLSGPEMQKYLAIEGSKMPTLKALYDDPDIAGAQPIIPRWRAVLEGAVARPSAVTLRKYNEVSNEFYTAVHRILAGQGGVEETLVALDHALKRIRGRGW